MVWPDGTRTDPRDVCRPNQRLVLDQPPPGVDEQTQQQRDCILALNAAGAKVGKLVGTRLRRVRADATAGALPPGTTAQTCLGERSRRPHRRRRRRAPRTSAATEVPADAHVRSRRRRRRERRDGRASLRPQDLFGPDLDAALRDAETDPAAARCQVAAAKSLAKIAAAKVKAFNACKATGLRSGAIRGAADLAGCHAATTGALASKAVAQGAEGAGQGLRRTSTSRPRCPGRCGGAALGALGELPRGAGGVRRVHGARPAPIGSAPPAIASSDGVATPTAATGRSTEHSIARQWDEVLLDAIRRDTPRPTVHARNLYHLVRRHVGRVARRTAAAARRG